MPKKLSYLNQEAAKALDIALMSECRYSLDQLMELAGLSVATAIFQEFPPTNTDHKDIYLVCGPGNNGGDGLVASRHLKHFGYNPTVVVPKPSAKTFYQNLLAQVTDLDIPITTSLNNERCGPPPPGLVVDAVFGFGFDSTSIIRSPFDTVLADINNVTCPVIAVDVPSGWDVDLGNTNPDLALKTPAMLISLTVPKLFAKTLDQNATIQYLGGRGFVPPALQAKFNLTCLPEYPGISQCVRL